MTKKERDAARARCEAFYGKDWKNQHANFVSCVCSDLPAALDDIDAWRERVRGWAELLHRAGMDRIAAEMRAALDPPEREEQAI